jgi:hypothetical protein
MQLNLLSLLAGSYWRATRLRQKERFVEEATKIFVFVYPAPRRWLTVVLEGSANEVTDASASYRKAVKEVGRTNLLQTQTR